MRSFSTFAGTVRPSLRLGAIVTFLIGAGLPALTSAATPESSDVVACYNSNRKLVTHTLPDLCNGEVITPEREAQLAAERRQRIQSTVQIHTDDPVTGTHGLPEPAAASISARAATF